MKDVILAAAISYEYSQVELFLRSIDKVYSGDVIIFSDKQYKLDDFNFSIKIIDPHDDLLKLPGVTQLNTPNNYRFNLYSAFLSKNKYNRILLTDCRDVVVQLNPFQKIDSDALYVAIEDNTIGNCVHNSKWIRILYGEEYFEEIKQRDIVCAGTIIGAYPAVMKYLDYITLEMEKLGPAVDTGDKVFMLDQGIINRFCNEFPGAVVRKTNADDIFLTAGYTTLFHCNKHGQIVNSAGSPYAVIHQFDRFEWMAHHLKNQYRDKNKAAGIKELAHLTKEVIKGKLNLK